ncbi:hypothetical protein G7066_11550 [Leucobacter coleopterorum]|uniref:Alpha-tubulin suppressor n=1 Tax=Leucobacter coleopterorum TaxID=2714933 RepID=A0ABX6JXK7_9MICO|nr:hypothetical protein [Leucobacter coleopterorum]QIM19044.1 hypothetical protein G7066_11550 [Leucobacter coleopterorum]
MPKAHLKGTQSVASLTVSKRRIVGALFAVLLALLTTITTDRASALFSDTGAVQTTFASTAAVELRFVGVAAGEGYSLGWTADGNLYAWGSNAQGQLGLGDRTARLQPTLIPFPPGTQIVEASAGIDMTIALTSTGVVYTWGNRDVTAGTDRPEIVPSLSALGVTGVSAGGYFFLAWTSSGQLYSWGNNGSGRLGRAGTGNDNTPARVTAQSLNSRVVVGADAGRAMGAAWVSGTTGTTRVSFWGDLFGSTTGQSGLGLPEGQSVQGLNVGSRYAFVWTSNGELYGGNTNSLSRVAGTTSSFIVGAEVSVPSAGALSYFAWDQNGALLAWGLNSSGQLGLGDVADRASPTSVSLPPGASVSSLNVGSNHSLFAGSNGAFSSAGSNAQGALGDNTTVPRNTFSVPVIILRWP